MRHAIRTTKLSSHTETAVLSFHTAAERSEYLSSTTNQQNVRAVLASELRGLRLGSMIKTSDGVFVRQVL